MSARRNNYYNLWAVKEIVRVHANLGSFSVEMHVVATVSKRAGGEAVRPLLIQGVEL